MCETEQLLFVGGQLNVMYCFVKPMNTGRKQLEIMFAKNVLLLNKRGEIIIDPTKDDRSTQHQEHFSHLLKIHQQDNSIS